MKIWYEFPRPDEGPQAFYGGRLKSNWEKISRPDTELVIKAPTRGTKEFEYSIVGHMYADMLRTVEMVEGVIQAEKEGYDGAVIGCFGDPGLDVLEALVDIPVMGPAKAASIMAQSVGSRMAFVTLPYWEKKVEKFIDVYGVRNLAISQKPCRALTIPLEQFSDENKVVDNFLDVAKGAINHGADVIVMACAHCSTLLTHKGISDVDGVPIIDGAISSIKLVEVMVDFKKAGLWRSKKTISKDIIMGLRKGYYYGGESA